MTPAKIKIGTGKIKCNSQKSSSQATTSMKSNHEYKLEESRCLEQKLLKRCGDFEQLEKIFHQWMKIIILIRSPLESIDYNPFQLISLNIQIDMLLSVLSILVADGHLLLTITTFLRSFRISFQLLHFAINYNVFVIIC